MKNCAYKSYNDLPIMLSVAQLADVLGVSRSSAYELIRTPGFPVVRIGSRVIVPRDKLIAWIDEKSSGGE